MYRTHHCGQLRLEHHQHPTQLAGWVARVRDHGGMRFIDLRDTYGVTQLVATKGTQAFDVFETLKPEWCIGITGLVQARPPALINKLLATGEIEVKVESVVIYGRAAELPLQISGTTRAGEETRLRHRYLDLRRDEMQRKMRLRSKIIAQIRQEMWGHGFDEFQTPILTSPSPEGARDFLVASSKHPGKFYALPQAPQLFKQMLMVGGFDKYFQIAPCFRDEAARSDRLPTEFYQLDLEMSFVSQDEIFGLVESVLGAVFKTHAGKQTPLSWTRMTYKHAKQHYATDKPDLRCPIKLQDVSPYFKDGPFGVFAKVLETPGTEIRALPAPGGGRRKFCEKMDAQARAAGLAGMAWIYWDETGQAKGPVASALKERAQDLGHSLGLGRGDAVFFLAGKPSTFEPFAALARVSIGQDLDLMKDGFAFAWITNFPLFEKTETGYEFEHNPFSMPKGGSAALDGDPLDVVGHQYDLACNGFEILSGALRCHETQTLLKSFAIAGYTSDQVQEKFGGLLRALDHGAPPHGGCAIGVERVVMLLAHETAIREVVAFPVTQTGEDILMNGPVRPPRETLKDLGL